MRWNPFSCVLSTDYFDNHVIISPNMLEGSMSQQSFMLIYFHCYHWGMDWFYQRELYVCGLLNGEHDEERANCNIEGGCAYTKDGSTDEEYDAYLQKKKQITAAFGKRVFDGAKSIGIMNDIFGYHDGHGEQAQGATILDLHEIAFRKFREAIDLHEILSNRVSPNRVRHLKTSYDKAVEAKIKQLREEYGAKRYSEL